MAGTEPSRELSDDSRIAVFQELLAKSTNGKLPKRAVVETAEKFKTSTRTVKRIWQRRKDATSPEEVVDALRSRRKGRCGRPRKDADAVIDALRAVPLRHRRTLRHAAEATGIAKSTLRRCLKEQEIKRVRPSLKPLLTDEKKIMRLK